MRAGRPWDSIRRGPRLLTTVDGSRSRNDNRDGDRTRDPLTAPCSCVVLRELGIDVSPLAGRFEAFSTANFSTVTPQISSNAACQRSMRAERWRSQKQIHNFDSEHAQHDVECRPMRQTRAFGRPLYGRMSRLLGSLEDPSWRSGTGLAATRMSGAYTYLRACLSLRVPLWIAGPEFQDG